jgi:hypothetical protein
MNLPLLLDEKETALTAHSAEEHPDSIGTHATRRATLLRIIARQQHLQLVPVPVLPASRAVTSDQASRSDRHAAARLASNTSHRLRIDVAPQAPRYRLSRRTLSASYLWAVSKRSAAT